MGDNMISVYRGDCRTVNIEVKAGDSVQDITGGSLWLTVKDTVTDPDVDAIMQVSGDVVSGLSGTAKFDISSTDTDNTPGEYTYDIQLKLSSGSVYTLNKDTFAILQDITLVS